MIGNKLQSTPWINYYAYIKLGKYEVFMCYDIIQTLAYIILSMLLLLYIKAQLPTIATIPFLRN